VIEKTVPYGMISLKYPLSNSFLNDIDSIRINAYPTATSVLCREWIYPFRMMNIFYHNIQVHQVTTIQSISRGKTDINMSAELFVHT